MSRSALVSSVTTTYNAANRPTSDSAGGSYSSDDDGRLTARPGQQLVWDDPGRLTQVKTSGGTTIATYTYDPLDRLRIVDHPGVDRIRFRYVGTTTSPAQLIDDTIGTVTRHIGTGWTGERLIDWVGSGSELRVYGTNAHNDVTWLASTVGSVSQSLRYDPWGTPRTAAPSGYSPFRYQGSWHDATTDLSWVITRWYAPGLGRFVSEDSLLGEPAFPDSRHLYVYGLGDPIARWDPDGRCPPPRTSYWKLYGCAKSSYARRQFVARPGLGRVKLALFIKQDTICAGWCGRGGADRRWSPSGAFNTLRSRAYIDIDFSNGKLFAIARPSCGVKERECHSANPWKSSGFNSTSVSVKTTFKDFYETRPATCERTWTKVTFALRESFTGFPLLPAINGSVQARRCKTSLHVKVLGDGFPHFELWYYRANGRAESSLHVLPAGEAQYLLPGAGDWEQWIKIAK